jgi:hypothetical protein
MNFSRINLHIILAFLLSDHGYDCWLGNSRGNDYGLKHKYLSTNSREFWNFSFHEVIKINVKIKLKLNNIF